MRIKIPYLFLLMFLVFSPETAFAQTSVIKISFASSPVGSSVCRAETSTNRFNVMVSLTLKPKTDSLQNASVEVINNDLVYSFKLEENVKAFCKPTQTGLEISLISDSNAGNNPQPSPSSNADNNNAPPQTAVRSLTTAEKKEVKKEALDLSVPESPGFTILGLNPQTVVRPASPREFATTLLNGLDENGNIQTGIAIDTAPYILLATRQQDEGTFNPDSTRRKPFLTLQKYRERPNGFNIARFASRIQFSLATTKGASSEDKSARIGSGLHFTIFDYGDPRMDIKLDECFEGFDIKIEKQARIDLNLSPTGLLPNMDDANKVEQRIQTLLTSGWRDRYKKTCAEESRKRNFARSSFIIGGAGSWISPNGDSSKFKYNGAGIWASLAYGFEGLPGLEENAQLIFHFRRRIKETVTDTLNQGKFITKDSNLFGMRLRFGSPNLAGNIEGVYQGEHFAGRKPDSNFKLSFGSDYKIADNLYINFAIGGETKESNIPNTGKVFVRTSFNWGTSQKPLN
jgi:hypothetical protein